MNISFDQDAWNEYKYWEFQDKKHLRRINRLISDILRNGPQNGIGKPEPLKYLGADIWSRRIDKANRLVYLYSSDDFIIESCHYHY
ncbi:Txe/YoeB family addiction module toxin [Acetilactobacillus jinshanensis]|uniref:Endoribonuclease YoeB n=1 Tax=Acetilactobacillus jinshanensis TaxID=1720083 RepID=A0A4P6ZLI4_9LACO|nr:Txe/YoeB family addiction module toxin [Acetilactobacillus jinshanensis]QBP18407.1 Txe/YoeB family addiction module toxin [Acetilactobacillus jinshanensis]URL61278.1 Txe/YoeB family addiction module toxin [uncultured bacterium]